MNAILSLLLACAAFCISPGFAQADERLEFFVHYANDGVSYEFGIPVAQARAIKPWNPRDGAPPLSPAAAVAAAEKSVRVRNPKVAAFEVSEIALSHAIWPSDLADRGYYRVDFNPKDQPEHAHEGAFTTVVLFDGTVVDPRLGKKKMAK